MEPTSSALDRSCVRRGSILSDSIASRDARNRCSSRENTGAEDDRLVAAASDIAAKGELHTHKQGTDGTMQMVHVPEGFPIPAGATHALQRGGDHVMFMGLTERPADGTTVHVTLTFEKAGVVELDVPVDSTR